ncbi:6-pyruvoyl tetrahydropterin synthase family protein [Streptomyces sp. NPDC005529]|uniref:6-pyruvoyl trahydropterin synthase family protein n=1 Tax=unclassified Streptomyces TaxID=2593676 RepID=UPI0033A477B0
MTTTIEKTFRFDAGHRALGFNYQKEETIHGHTWELRLVVEAPGGLDSKKTIFDTNDLAVIVKPIISELDHSFILWREDPIYQEFVALCKLAGIEKKLYPVDFNPTLEGIVEHLYCKVNSQLDLGGPVLARAELNCTATLRATYEP